MSVAFYWWGFRVYVVDSMVHQLISALQGGEAPVREFLNQQGLGWLAPLASAIINWGVTTLSRFDSQCNHSGCSFTVNWSQWNSYVACR